MDERESPLAGLRRWSREHEDDDTYTARGWAIREIITGINSVQEQNEWLQRALAKVHGEVTRVLGGGGISAQARIALVIAYDAGRVAQAESAPVHLIERTRTVWIPEEQRYGDIIMHTESCPGCILRSTL